MITTDAAAETESKVALITGASRGIGEAIALNLAHEHFDVALVGREANLLEEVAKHCRVMGVHAECYIVDLRDNAAVTALVDQVANDFGGISLLVNNAGVSIEKDIRHATLEDWDVTISVNLNAVFLLTKYCLPYLEEAHNAAVINIASVASTRGYPGGTMYTAAKHGLLGFSRSLFDDVHEAGIKVCSIMPGYVNTAMHSDDHGVDPLKMLQPEDVARAVTFVVNFPENACPTEITLLPQRSPKITQTKGAV